MSLSTPKRSKLATLFVILVSLFPALGKRLWRLWYNFLARRDRDADLNFMNYGYLDPDWQPVLEPADEKNRLPIQLYEQLLRGICLDNRHLLEVGSGRGGGLYYLSRYKKATALTGIDIAEEAIKRCQQSFHAPNLTYIQGSADNLPLADQSQDIVINVESSHCYPDFDAFVREALRVLKPGGQFCLCDLRPAAQVESMERSFSQAGFVLQQSENITKQVLAALDAMSEERTVITSKIPAWLQAAFRDFAGVKSSAVYEMMKSGQLVYMSYQLTRADN